MIQGLLKALKQNKSDHDIAVDHLCAWSEERSVDYKENEPIAFERYHRESDPGRTPLDQTWPTYTGNIRPQKALTSTPDRENVDP